MWVRAFSRGCTTMSPMPWDWSTAAACSASPAQPPAEGVIAAPTTNCRVASCSARLPAAGRARRVRRRGGDRGAARPVCARPGPDRLGRGPDVRRRGAAAAAHDRHPGVGEPAEVAGEVPAVDAELERARADPARLPGVRLRADGHRRVPDEVLGDDEHPLRPHRAVGAEHRDRHRAQHGGDLARRLAAQGVRVVRERGLRDQRQVGHRRGHRHRLDQLVQVAERLQDQQVDVAAGDQRPDLLGQHLHPLGGAHPAPLQRGHRGRDRARDQDGTAGPAGGGPGEAHPGPVDLLHLVRESVVAEPEPVGAERVGLDDVRARGQVAVVDRLHQARVGQVQLGQRPVERGARRVQHGAHGTVADEHPPARQQLALARGGTTLLITVPPATRPGFPARPARSAGPGSCPGAAR